jgi:hypothetical protein
VEVFSGLSDEESMRDVGFLIEKVLGKKVVRSAILDGVLIFYVGPSDQHEHVVGQITRSVWNSLEMVLARLLPMLWAVVALPVCALREVKCNRTPLGNPLDELYELSQLLF